MHEGDILILNGREVTSFLEGQEAEVIRTVRLAYEAHAEGQSSLPHSTFLRFPDDQKNRIIALPAYLGAGFNVAGMKWVASFPGNHEKGFDRASAVVILNSTQTGRPVAILEGSTISARRTAASAALAAASLHNTSDLTRAGIIGCGLINFEVVRFLLAVAPNLNSLVLFDPHAERMEQFGKKCRDLSGQLEAIVTEDVRTVLESCGLISLATTAAQPHIADLSMCAPGSTVLHISLRDLTPEVILSGENVVDDIDHVCRAQTSVHLAEQLVGTRDFIRCTLADILTGKAAARREAKGTAIFSPFGLGVLDLALGNFVYEQALKEKKVGVISQFLPESWVHRDGKNLSR